MERIGPYPVEGVLSRGGMGVIYRGLDPALDRPVAIKVLAGSGWDQVDLERFQQEARTTARLRHPHVVGIHGAGRTPQGPYLALDLVEGGSLQERLQRGGPLPAREAARIARALASALAYAHGQGVVHRDVKPQNVLLERGEHPLLADFGLSQLLDDSRADQGLTKTGEVVGSPNYMAPEQAAARRDRIGPVTDVYGLGATLYAMLTGRPPFLGADVYELLRAVRDDAPAPLPPDVDPALAAICRRCLAKSPDDRYPSAFALERALERFLEGPPPEPAAPPPARRRAPPALLAAAGAGLLLLGLLLLGLLLGRLSARAPEPLAATPSPSPASGDELSGEALDRFRRGVERGGRDDGQGAEEDFTRVLELAPAYAPASYERAAARLQRKDYPGALRDLERAQAARPRDAEKVHFLRSKVLAAQGEHRAAIAELDRALALRPVYAVALVARGLSKEKLPDPAGARADYEAALAQDPRLGGACFRLAVLAFEAGDWARTHEQLARTLALDAEFVPARVLRARTHLKQGGVREALEDQDAVVRAALEKHEVLVDRAEARVRLRSYDLARRDAELALEVDPTLVHAALYLALAKEGQAVQLVAQRQLQGARRLLLEAMDDLRRARAQQPDDPELLDAIRVLLERIQASLGQLEPR